MKIVAFTRVHYGLDYLEYVIRSTAGFAEQHIVMYTPSPSPGFQATFLECPDSKQDLYRAAHNAAGPRLMWVDEVYPRTEAVLALRPDADLVLELDADEIPDPELLEDIRQRADRGALTANQYRLPFIHYWRSFKYVCRDTNYPVRLVVPHNRNNEVHFWPDGESHGVVHHFGYARSVRDMRYKLDVSAHRPEFRADWWQDVYLQFPERMVDLHPVCVDGFWNAEPANRPLPPVMASHPFRNLEVIK